MAWLYSDAFSDAPNTPGETVFVFITNPSLSESRQYPYSRYGFEDNAAFEARVRADIQAKLDLLNAQYNRRQSQAQRFRPTGSVQPSGKPTSEGGS